MELPYDDTGSIAANKDKTIWLADRLGKKPAAYCRLDVTQDAKVWIHLMNGSTFLYSRGARASIPLELMGYQIRGVTFRTTYAATWYVHATTDSSQDECSTGGDE